MRFIKNKSRRKFLYLILFFIGIYNFPYLGLLFLVFLIIALMFESGGKDAFKQDLPQKKKNKKDNSKRLKVDNPDLQKLLNDLETKDISEMGNIYEQTQRIIKTLQTPTTFFEIIGEISTKVDIYYFQGLFDPNKQKDNESDFIIESFERGQRCCDEFFDGKEYMKCWAIFRALERKGVTEEEFNKVFPKLVPIVQQIRNRYWEDIAWSWLIADKAEKKYGKDTCTKEIYLKVEKEYSIREKENFLKTLPEENKKDYQLLIELNLEEEEKKDQEITENFLRSFDVSKFSGKPKKIKSEFKWKLEDAIKFAEIVQGNYSDLAKLSAYGEYDELKKKKLQYAGLVRSFDFYESIYGKEFVNQIQSIERVSDFYQFEMFDEDRIQTAIDNEDIERMMFYSLIQIPKRVISQLEKVSTDDPEKRAPYFSIMYAHTKIILMVLEDLGIYNHKEIIIESWILNQILDPLDKGDAMLSFNKNNKKGNGYDERFVREIWIPLYRLLELELGNPKGLIGEVEKVIQIIESVFISALYNYFVGDPEEGYKLMRPMYDKLQEQEENSESLD